MRASRRCGWRTKTQYTTSRYAAKNASFRYKQYPGSKTKQQESDLSSVAGAPSWRPCFRDSLSSCAKEIDSAEREKTVPAKSKRRKKSYVHFNFSQWWTWTRPQPKSLDFGHLPVVNSQEESPTSGFPPNSRCGPILTRVGASHMKTNISNLFDVGVTFFSAQDAN